MQILTTLIWAYKFVDEYPFKYDKNWILLIFMWGLSILTAEFLLALSNALEEK